MPKTKKTKSSGKTESSKKTTGAKTKKSSPKGTASKRTDENSFIAQLTPYILAAVAVLLAVCLIVDEGVVGRGIRDVLAGLFGTAAYFLPILLLVRCLFWNRDREEGRGGVRTLCTVILAILAAMLSHILGGGYATLDARVHYEAGADLWGGGVIGGILGELLLRGFGRIFSLIVLFAAVILLALYIAGLTPRGVAVFHAYHLDRILERRREKKAAEAERRENYGPTKNQVREEKYLAYLREKRRREQEARAAEAGQTPAQIPMDIPAPTAKTERTTAKVYHVKKRRLTELDIPVSGPAEHPGKSDAISVSKKKRRKQNDAKEEGAYDRDTGWAADAFRDPDTADEAQKELASPDIDTGVVDEKIFDEVMRRTRERVEKSRKQSGVTELPPSSELPAAKVQPVVHGGEPIPEDHAGDEFDFLPDDGTPAGESHAARPTAKPVRADETDTVSLASSMAADSEGGVADLFVNPEDAELLDRLSEQYRNPLEVKRETVSAPEPPKLAAPAAPPYVFPPLDLLTEDPGGVSENIRDELQENAVKLVDTLKSFRVNTKIENISRGPTITRYELVPEPGTKVRSITNLVDDIALNLATTGVRIEAPIPGKSAVGIEVPNKKRTTVHLRTLLETETFQSAKSRLFVALGEDVAGDAVFFDIGKMPHLLIAGTTGSGKSVCINTIIMSLLYKASPDDVKMILIDPKKVELNIYNGIPHLLVPVVSEPKKAAGALSWAVSEMERRYGLIEDAGKRNIGEYNKLADANPDYEHLPSIVIIIDELADLMMTAPDDVEDSICRIAQKARAAGMYLIVGTQRPSVDVITGLIKANIPSRIAFRTSNQVDSRTIIDIGSAANLIGMGDMLFAPVGAMKPNRVQGAFVSEDEVMEAVSYIRNMNHVTEGYSDEIVNQIEREAQKCGVGKKGAAADEEAGDDAGDEDPMLKSAIEVALDAGKISTSLIQRRLQLGYGRAAKLIDRM
ncbi:MAG: DNA translocase FtsK, partial [Clostridia bacterium]|nr:DNA translocase FtsK [Clostridia bacterium]